MAEPREGNTHDCPQLETLIAFHEHELSDADIDAVEAHVFGCAMCAGALEAMNRGAEQVGGEAANALAFRDAFTESLGKLAPAETA